MADQLIGRETGLADGAYANLVWDGKQYQYKVYSPEGNLLSSTALTKDVVPQLKAFASSPNTTLVRGIELDEKTGFRRVGTDPLIDEPPMYVPGLGETSGLTEGVDYTETPPSESAITATGTMSPEEIAKARTEELKKAQSRRNLAYGGAMALGEMAATASMFPIREKNRTQFEKDIRDRADDTPEGMSAQEEADLTRFIFGGAQKAAREGRMRGEAIQAARGGITSARDALQEKTAQAQGLAEAAVRAGAIIAQEKSAALQQDIAEIKDAQASVFAMDKERRKQINNFME